MSIRWVTAKPPKMLTDATTVATKARIWTQTPLAAVPMTAPTTMMPEIAFVTDMSGVCREWVTFVMT